MSYVKNLALLIASTYSVLSCDALGQDRRIKPGDVIEIAVSGHAESSRTAVVDMEGRLDYPILDGLPVDNISLQRLREIVGAQLFRYMDERPLVAVRFTEGYPIKVTVLGQVAKPGT